MLHAAQASPASGASAAVVSQVGSIVHQEVYDFLVSVQLASYYGAIADCGASCLDDLHVMEDVILLSLGVKELEVKRLRRQLGMSSLTGMGFSEAEATAALGATEPVDAATEWLLQGGTAAAQSRMQLQMVQEREADTLRMAEVENEAADAGLSFGAWLELPHGMVQVARFDGEKVIVRMSDGTFQCVGNTVAEASAHVAEALRKAEEASGRETAQRLHNTIAAEKALRNAPAPAPVVLADTGTAGLKTYNVKCRLEHLLAR